MDRIFRWNQRATWVAVLVAAGAGCSAPQVRSQATAATASATAEKSLSTYRVVDATGAFWSFWDAHATDDPASKATAFRQMVIGGHPELFEPNVVGVDPTRRSSDLDERLGPFLADLPNRIDTMRRVSEQVASDLQRYDSSFRTLFPDMKWSGTIYFTISVDAFDGAIRRVAGKPCLLFGIDKIAKVHGQSSNLGPFFHHELFHVYHDDVNPPPQMLETGPHGLLEPLWREGLAVYISSVLHEGATPNELLLSEEMIRDGTAKLPQLAAELQRLLDDAQEIDYRDFFLGRGQRADVPKRVAYFVGFLVAKELAMSRAIPVLVRLRGTELRAAVDGVLSGFVARKSIPAPASSQQR